MHKRYCQARNKMQKIIRKGKSEFIANKIEEHKGDSKKLWQQLKNLGYSNSSSEASKMVLKVENKLYFEEDKVANIFNDFFTTVATKLVEKLPAPPRVFNTSSPIFKNYYRSKGVTEYQFSLTEVYNRRIYI